MLNSLRSRMVAASLLVVLVAVAVTAWAVNRTTSGQVREAVTEDLEAEEAIYSELSFYAFTNGSWDDVDGLVASLADEFGQRVALTTVDGDPIADSASGDAGLPDSPARFIDPDSPVIEFAEPPPGLLDGLAHLSDRLGALSDTLAEAGVPFTVGEDFGLQYPVWDLGDPEAGALAAEFFLDLVAGSDYHLPFEVPGEIVGTGGEIDALSEFLGLLGIDHDVHAGGAAGQQLEWNLADEEAVRAIEDFFSGAGGGFDPVAQPLFDEPAEPALLFLGYPGLESGVPDPIGWRLVAIVLLLAALAVIASLVISGRVLRPVGALTAAARRMGGGDLAERVKVGGSDEIAELAGAFNSMAESLEAQDGLRKAMTGDIAHELRTPLSNIRGYLEAMREGVVEPTPELIASLHDEAVQLQALVDELQDLALAEAGELRIEPEDVELRSLLGRVVQAHRPRAELAGIDLRLADGPQISGRADPGRIRQVVGNLLDNAIRHTPDGGSVTVALQEFDGDAAVTVTDSGSGIAPEHLPRVFDRLYRADPSRSRETGGSGLGLAIARELIRLHGGDITVESEIGAGSIFTVTLPGAAPVP